MHNLYIMLEQNKHYLLKQQYRTIKGQIKCGDTDGAIKGLNKIIRKGR